MIGFQDIGGDLHNFYLPCAFAIQRKFLICTSSGGVPQYLVINFFKLCTYTSIIFTPVESLTNLSSITKKGEIVSASSAPLVVLEYWRQIGWGTNVFVSIHRRQSPWRFGLTHGRRPLKIDFFKWRIWWWNWYGLWRNWCEDFEAWRLCFHSFFSSYLSHRKNRTVKGGLGETFIILQSDAQTYTHYSRFEWSLWKSPVQLTHLLATVTKFIWSLTNLVRLRS